MPVRLTAKDLQALGADHPLVRRLHAQGVLTSTGVQGATAGRSNPGGSAGRLSAGEEQFALQLRAAKLPQPEREYRFHPTRQFRLDFAWPTLGDGRKLAVEIEGGIHSQGRHVRPHGYKRDLEKYNAAVAHGWTLMRFSTSMVFCGEALAAVEAFFAPRRP